MVTPVKSEPRVRFWTYSTRCKIRLTSAGLASMVMLTANRQRELAARGLAPFGRSGRRSGSAPEDAPKLPPRQIGGEKR